MAILKQRDTSLYIQTQPGMPTVYLGDCVDLDAIPNPRAGVELIQCWNRQRDGFVTKGERLTPPGNLEFTITELLESASSYLEDMKCPFTVFALQRTCGNAGVFNNWERGAIVHHVRITDDTLNNVAHHVDDNESTHEYSLSGWVPRVDVFPVSVGSITTTEPEALNAISVCKNLFCGDVCAEQAEPCDALFAGADAASGLTADVVYSNDNGENTALGAVDPFIADENIISVVCFSWAIGIGVGNRWLVVRDGDAANPLEVAYSDDDGASWTLVVVGATANEAASGPNALFAIDGSHIWLCTDDGNVFFSGDGGETWADQGALVPSGGNALNCINFADEEAGYAVGDADTVIYTSNGGDTWIAGTATGLGVNLTAVVCFSPYRAIVGSAIIVGGALVMTFDQTATWAHRTFVGHTVEAVAAISFYNELRGALVSNVGAVGSLHMTIDGGATWYEVVMPTNTGLNDIDMCDMNEAFIVGEVLAGAIAGFFQVSK